jgi:hypothetical protein
MSKELYKNIDKDFNKISDENISKIAEVLDGSVYKNWKRLKLDSADIIDINTGINSLKLEPTTKFLKGKTYIIISIGLIASGKSTIFKTLKEIVDKDYPNQIALYYISSDEMKKKLMDEYITKFPKTTYNEAHDIVNKSATGKLNRELSSLIMRASDPNRINFVLIDKNFPINQANKLITEYKKNFIVFYPKVKPDDITRLPFSFSYMIQCYYRLKNRKHETLDFEKNEYAHYILFSFLSLYKNEKIEFEQKNVFAYPLSYTDESGDIEYDSYFIHMFNKMMYKMGRFAFRIEQLKAYDADIKEVVNFIENNYAETLYLDTRNNLRKELEQLLNNMN